MFFKTINFQKRRSKSRLSSGSVSHYKNIKRTFFSRRSQVALRCMCLDTSGEKIVEYRYGISIFYLSTLLNFKLAIRHLHAIAVSQIAPKGVGRPHLKLALPWVLQWLPTYSSLFFVLFRTVRTSDGQLFIC